MATASVQSRQVLWIGGGQSDGDRLALHSTKVHVMGNHDSATLRGDWKERRIWALACEQGPFDIIAIDLGSDSWLTDISRQFLADHARALLGGHGVLLFSPASSGGRGGLEHWADDLLVELQSHAIVPRAIQWTNDGGGSRYYVVWCGMSKIHLKDPYHTVSSGNASQQVRCVVHRLLLPYCDDYWYHNEALLPKAGVNMDDLVKKWIWSLEPTAAPLGSPREPQGAPTSPREHAGQPEKRQRLR